MDVLFKMTDMIGEEYRATGECLIIKDAKSEAVDTRELIMADFVENFSLLEEAAKRGDFAAVSDVADVKSLAEYFLISEFASNPDAHNSSFNFYKDGFSDKRYAENRFDLEVEYLIDWVARKYEFLERMWL